MESNSIKVLVTGSKGQLGSEIKAIFQFYPMLNLTFTDIDELDIIDLDAVDSFIKILKPDFVINCAAYTAVDLAEKEIELATKLNSLAPSNIAKSCLKYGSKMIHISTDYVFDGNSNTPYIETSTVNPISHYGKTKLKGEEGVLSTGIGMVIRTSWLYSSYGSNFVKTILRNAKIKPELRVVSDQIGCPTYARDLATVIMEIVLRGKDQFIPEIFHYSNEGICSWYDFACQIISLTKIDCKIIPIETKDYPLPTKRPQYSVFSKSKISKLYNVEIPNWNISLGKCIEILRNEGLT